MTIKAMPVSMRANVFFSTSKVATTNAANEKPITRIVDGSPSLYITIKKEKYTSAKPVSLCIRVNAAGNKTIAAAINCDLVVTNSVSDLRKIFCQCKTYADLAKLCRLKLKSPKTNDRFCSLYAGMKRKHKQQ